MIALTHYLKRIKFFTVITISNNNAEEATTAANHFSAFPFSESVVLQFQPADGQE
jgi:hypothetical protein